MASLPSDGLHAEEVGRPQTSVFGVWVENSDRTNFPENIGNYGFSNYSEVRENDSPTFRYYYAAESLPTASSRAGFLDPFWNSLKINDEYFAIQATDFRFPPLLVPVVAGLALSSWDRDIWIRR